MINWANSKKGECVVCSAIILNSSFFICKKCKKICEYYPLKKFEGDGKYMIMDIKSKCCSADVWDNIRNTCSNECHEKLVAKMQKNFGQFKKVVDGTTLIAYKVPTRDIIEKGLNAEDLSRYPQWSNKDE